MDLSILRLQGEYLTDLGVNGSILLKQGNAVYAYAAYVKLAHDMIAHILLDMLIKNMTLYNEENAQNS